MIISEINPAYLLELNVSLEGFSCAGFAEFAIILGVDWIDDYPTQNVVILFKQANDASSYHLLRMHLGKLIVHLEMHG